MGVDQSTGQKTRERGFTLIEVIVAISILTVGLLAVAKMQTAAIQGNFFAYRTSQATTLAQDRLEYLLALPYGDALLQDGDDQADPAQGTHPVDTGLYAITYNVAVDSPIAGAKRITVRVVRTEKGVTRPPIELTCVKVDV
ncbi:MAG: prepilin-type N-terminal cleavage/methylation domain-containing protein [Deltaproteobacteria bacterium]|nr:prepilin-type N-terminal cleavage/methylation domain-containing protein [Deltaproteobacteria bacterium]